MSLFKRKCLFSLKRNVEIATVAVPDIKEYLIRGYEHEKCLEQTIANLKAQIEEFEDIKKKYEASLVTLDAYSAKINRMDATIAAEAEKTARAKEETARVKDELNSCKIRLETMASAKKDMVGEIVEELKISIMRNITSHRGNLSKVAACNIVENTNLPEV